MSDSVANQLKVAAKQHRDAAKAARAKADDLLAEASFLEKEADRLEAAYAAYGGTKAGKARKKPGPKKGYKKKAGKKKGKKAVAATAAASATGKKKGKKKAAKKATKKAGAKPGPKPGKKKGKKKAAKKAGAKKAAKATATSDGKLTLKQKLKIVMGSNDCKIPEVIQGLQERGWEPESKDLSTYISFMLSSSKKDFERVSRGVYRVIANADEKGGNGKKPKGKGAKPVTAKNGASVTNLTEEDEANLAELGVDNPDVAANPFV